MTAAALPSLWLGPAVHEAVAAYHRARAAGLSVMRSLTIGNVASFRDGWAFRKKIAQKIGGSVRTVGRALEQGRREGLIGVARAKKGERAPDEDGKPTIQLPCGFSHRWTIGWGRAGEQVKAAISAAKAKFLARQIVKGKAGPPISRRSERRWTAAELDAELERRARSLAPPPPEAPPRE